MDLFKRLQLRTECYLCGCGVANEDHSEPRGNNTSNNSLASIICYFCHQKLPRTKSQCFSCGLPLFLNSPSARTSNINSQNVCGSCLCDSPPFDRTISAFHYEEPVSDFITQLKYSAKLQLLPVLCDYLLASNLAYSFQCLCIQRNSKIGVLISLD